MSLFRDTLRPPAHPVGRRRSSATSPRSAPSSSPTRSSDAGSAARSMNRFVAAREGIGRRLRRERTMGRLGRAVPVRQRSRWRPRSTSVLAASQEALPGDLLYPLKRQRRAASRAGPARPSPGRPGGVRARRAHRRARRLAERGDDARVAALARHRERDYEAFVDAEPSRTQARTSTTSPCWRRSSIGCRSPRRQRSRAPSSARRAGRTAVLDELLERLPEPAQAAIEVIERPAGRRRDRPTTGSADAPTVPQGGATGGSTADRRRRAGGDGRAGSYAGADASPGQDATPTPSRARGRRASRNGADADADHDAGDSTRTPARRRPGLPIPRHQKTG